MVTDLRDASPFLDDGLDNLPPVSNDVRDLMPPLSKTIDRSGGTFDRIPRFTDHSQDTIPAAREFVRDLGSSEASVHVTPCSLATRSLPCARRCNSRIPGQPGISSCEKRLFSVSIGTSFYFPFVAS